MTRVTIGGPSRTDGVCGNEKGKMTFNGSRRDADHEIGLSYPLSLMRCVQWLTRGDLHSYLQLFQAPPEDRRPRCFLPFIKARP